MQVESTVIKSIEYFEKEEVLEIVFLRGASYAYYFVEPKKFQDFANAESKGAFYNEKIKGIYDSSKLG